jgi:hypothetical protein
MSNFLEDANLINTQNDSELRRKYADLNPYNIEKAQGFYMEFSPDIVYDLTKEPPASSNPQFVWSNIFIPYKQVENKFAPYHIWLHFKIGEKGNWSSPIRLTYGKDGTNGKDGTVGSNGFDGVSIVSAEVRIDGHLWLYLSNSIQIDAGYVMGASAPLILVQYSIDGIVWSNTPTTPTFYIRFSNDNGTTWGDAVEIVADTSNLVPYTGAITNVLLGNNNLSSSNLQVPKDNFIYFSLNEGTDTIGDRRIGENGNVWICDSVNPLIPPGIGTGIWHKDNRPTSFTNYLGEWNANTNNPIITSGIGNAGDWYIVSVAGSTIIDGIDEWDVTDYIWFSGDIVTWQRISNVGGVIIPFGHTGTVQINKNGIFSGSEELDWDFNDSKLAIGNTTKTEKLNIEGTIKLTGLAGLNNRTVVVNPMGVLETGISIDIKIKEFYFSMAGDEVTTWLETPLNVTSVVLGNASALLYSIDNGVNWITYSTPVTLPVGQLRLKILAWIIGYDGSIIIKGT